MGKQLKSCRTAVHLVYEYAGGVAVHYGYKLGL